MGSLTFDPLIPSPLLAALVVGAAALLAWYGWHRPGVVPVRRWRVIVGLMSLAVALVLVILLSPIMTRNLVPPGGKPLLTILVDSTESMRTADAPGGRTRYDAAVQTARTLSDHLSDTFDVRISAFAGAPVPTSLHDLAAGKPDGEETDLAGAISASLDEQRPRGQALALLSDGGQNAGGGSDSVLAAVRIARALAAPIYTQTLGGGATAPDVSVEIRTPQDLAFVGQSVPLSVRVKATGFPAGHTEVLLVQDGKEIARRPVDLSASSATDVLFSVSQAKVGMFHYDVKALPVAGELEVANNQAAFVLRVVDEPIRVLVLEGKPYWDSKFLMRTLSDDPAVAVDSIVRLNDSRYMRRTISHDHPATAPADRAAATATAPPTTQPAVETWNVMNNASSVLTPDRLRGYQVLVLGRDSEAFLTDQAVTSVQEWIASEGGALVCYRGSPTQQPDQKIARLLPVKWSPAVESRFRVKLTDQGRDLHWWGTDNGDVLDGLPTLASAQQSTGAKAMATVLATEVNAAGEQRPAVAYQPYGTGRVVVIEGSGMWRWAFLPPDFQDQEQLYSGLWRSLLRWLTSGESLVPGQKMLLRADRVTFDTNDSASATLLLRDDPDHKPPPRVLVKGVSGSEIATVTPVPVGQAPGTYAIPLGKLPEGRYSLRVEGSADADSAAQASFDVRNLGQEMMDLAARPDLMARIATDSGGGILGADAAGDLERQFRAYVNRAHPAQVERTVAWDRWWILLAIFACWGASWALRRGGGLV